MAEFQSKFTGQEIENTIDKLRNWLAAGVDGTYPTVTISSVTYDVIWKVIPTPGAKCYGIGLDRTTGRPYEIYYDGSSYKATALDVNTDTKNTAGSSNSDNKLFIVGAAEQSASGVQTYSNSNAYIKNGLLYSGGAAVLTAHAAEYGKIKVSGGEAKTADSAQDTIEFAAGGNLSVARAGDKITYSYSTPDALKNPNKLNLKVNSETSNFVEYDGSAAKTVTVKPSTTAGAFVISDGATDKTIQLAGAFTDNDTKNTAGSSNSNSKLFIIGASTQAANPQTYSNSKVYMTDGTLNASSIMTGYIKSSSNNLSLDVASSDGSTCNVAIFGANSDEGTSVTLYGHLAVFGDDDSNSPYKPADKIGSSDLDAYYFNTGIALYNYDDDTTYKLSFPAKSGTFATLDDTKIEIVDLTTIA